MDGHYLNKEKITKSVFEWLSTAILNDTSWEGNNLHIDEVISLENINRNDWIIYSVLVFQIILDEVEIKKPYVSIKRGSHKK